MTPFEIEIHIEELVLHGFTPGTRWDIADALERELAEAVSQPGAFTAQTEDREIARLDAGNFHLPADTPAPLVGQQIARTILGGLAP